MIHKKQLMQNYFDHNTVLFTVKTCTVTLTMTCEAMAGIFWPTVTEFLCGLFKYLVDPLLNGQRDICVWSLLCVPSEITFLAIHICH